MNFPRIYSLSTVGIVKHYIHDYLFHPKRTDFIGPNGVGKSIISDLLQMTFIFDKELIKFGTDGLKKEERSIHKLPYKTKYAYSFLNIEIKKGIFICIGIQINNQSNKRILPFIICKETNLSLGIELLALNKTELLFAKNLLIENTIPDIEDLADRLGQSNLKLIYFKNNDEINNYYQFLADKKILPLNLAIEKNLKAFAKIIQSFSKAKAINLSGNQASKNLKEFLFEDSDEDILNSYEKEKIQLEKILKEYQSLNDSIRIMGEKQTQLSGLKTLETKSNEEKYIYEKAILSNLYFEINNLNIQEEKLSKQYDKCINARDKTLKAIAKTPIVENYIRSKYNKADENVLSFEKYSQLRKESKFLEEEISSLESIDLPIIDKSWIENIDKIDISLRNSKNFIDAIASVKPILKQYSTLINVTSTRTQQLNQIDSLKASLKAEKTFKEKFLKLLTDKGDNSLLNWVIQKKPIVSAELAQALFYFATVSIKEINDPANESNYIDPEELVNNFTIKTNNNGLWLKLGPLFQFIENNNDAKMLQNIQNLNESINKLIEKTETEINSISLKQNALLQILDGETYDNTLFNFNIDKHIIPSNSINNIKISVAHIIQFDEKIFDLKRRKSEVDTEKNKLEALFNTNNEVLSEIKDKLIKTRAIWNSRKDLINEIKGSNNGKIGPLETELVLLQETLSGVQKINKEKQTNFKDLNEEFIKIYNENLEFTNSEVINIEYIKTEFETSLRAYQDKYLSISHYFIETKNENSQSVQFELNNKTYSFRVLEEALLGNKIKTTDDITTALNEANSTRTIIANGIRDNLIKIFNKTNDRYEKYRQQIQKINAFFVNRKISRKFQFRVDFNENADINIRFANELAHKVRQSATQGELQFGQSISEFLEDFFKKQARLKLKVPIEKLLDPKTFFDLSAHLSDEFGEEVPGSTGESYSAIALLGIARLSVTQQDNSGLRFLILEELGSLDETNFNTFPEIAEEFKYQIITMAPHVFNLGLTDEWYAHHLIKGKQDEKINYSPSASFFKRKDFSEDLNIYLSKL